MKRSVVCILIMALILAGCSLVNNEIPSSPQASNDVPYIEESSVEEVSTNIQHENSFIEDPEILHFGMDSNLNLAMFKVGGTIGSITENTLVSIANYYTEPKWSEFNTINNLDRAENISVSEYFIIIPKYTGSKITIYDMDIHIDRYPMGEPTIKSTLFEFEDTPDDYALVVQANAPDIYCTQKIVVEYKGEAADLYIGHDMRASGPLRGNVYFNYGIDINEKSVLDNYCSFVFNTDIFSYNVILSKENITEIISLEDAVSIRTDQHTIKMTGGILYDNSVFERCTLIETGLNDASLYSNESGEAYIYVYGDQFIRFDLENISDPDLAENDINYLINNMVFTSWLDI